MSRHLTHAAIVLAAASMFVLPTGATAQTTDGDTTPPTAPYIIYYSGLRWTAECQTVTVGLEKSTDDVTPQLALTYEVFADGVYLGTLIDWGNYSSVWGTLKLKHAGSNTITAKAVDAAGNRSAPSNAVVVTGYAC